MKSRVIKKGFPRIIQTWVNDDKIYQVDCRKEGWTGQQRFNFHSEGTARAKAKEIEKIFAEQGAQGALISLQDRLMVQAALVPLVTAECEDMLLNFFSIF